MSNERAEWVEIIEPKTKEHMYANLTTGECVWDPPEGVYVKKTDSSQWWELFDINTHRFYYYNATTQTTVWHRPSDCDIIPLAKLQTLKQNTDPMKRRETSTQTNQALQVSNLVNQIGANGTSSASGSAGKVFSSNPKSLSLNQTSPVRTRRSHYQHRCSGEGRKGRLSEEGVVMCRHTDSGRSSDSSISSAQQKRKQELNASNAVCNLPSCTPQQRKRSSVTHVQDNDKCSPRSGLNRSGSFVSPRKDASDDSMHEKYFKSVESTPLTRRKLKQSAGSSESASPQSPGSPHNKQPPAPLLQTTSARPSLVSSISLATENAGAAAREGGAARPAGGRVMHSLERPHHLTRNARERYSDRHLDKERLVELERNLERGYPDKQAVYSVDKPFRQTSLDLRHNINQPPPNWHGTRDFTRRQQAEPERCTSSKHSLSSGSSKQRGQGPDTSPNYVRQTSATQLDSIPAVVNYKLKSISLEPPLTQPNLERHNAQLEAEREKEREREREKESIERQRTYRSSRKHKRGSAEAGGGGGGGGGDGGGAEVAEETDEGGSPVYSNWDLRALPHLLPLQHYILQQAKISNRSRYGPDWESGSGSGSDSGSSRSLSGHEPDDDSSDGARTADDDDGSGVYLPHAYTCQPRAAAHAAHTTHTERSAPQEEEYMNHGVAYYNTFVGFEKEQQPTPIQRTSSLSGGPGQNEPVSEPGALYSPVRAHPAPHPAHPAHPAPPPEQDIELFAKDNLNFNKGIFRKKASVRDMLSWTSSSISAPMVGARWDKEHKKAATDMFRLVQIYMGDRKARPGMTLNSVAHDTLSAAFNNVALRDELYVQLCRQTTENPLRDSLLRGWELLAVCLAFVPPSRTFQPALTNYVNRHRDPAFADAFPEVGKWPIHVQVSHYASVACKRLERIGHGGRRAPRKPGTEDIDQARIQIFRQSMFGNTLPEVMAMQKERFPSRQLPWVQVALSQQVLAMQGRETEGIFRVPADAEEVTTLKAKIDNWEMPDASTLTDAHAPASVLKLWYRELYEPLIPDSLYAACVACGGDSAAAMRVLHRLPPINRLVLTYLISFLQEFTAPEVVSQTKMDSANLAMVFAPNCLRCTSQDPRVILENARKEMTFLKALITSMDTSQVKDLL